MHPAQRLLEAYLDLQAIDRKIRRGDYARIAAVVVGVLGSVAVFAVSGLPWGLLNLGAAVMLALSGRRVALAHFERRRDLAHLEPAAKAAYFYLRPSTKPAKVMVRIEIEEEL